MNSQLRGQKYRQAQTTECGLMCLAAASSFLGRELDVHELRREFPASVRGATLLDLVGMAEQFELRARPVRCDLSELATIQCPAILHWDLDHFVLLIHTKRNCVVIFDPARGLMNLPWIEASKSFTGVAAEISPGARFQKRSAQSNLKLLSLFKFSRYQKADIFQALFFSVALQICALGAPLYIQLVVDESVLRGDDALLFTLAIGFFLLAVFSGVVDLLRAVAMQRLSSAIGWLISANLFSHMIRLPLSWFSTRRLADALTRYESVNPIRNLLANGLVSSVIDGALSISTLAVMFYVSPYLAGIALAGMILTVGLRLAALPMSMKYGVEALTSSIAEQGKRIETLRAIQTIKAMGGEQNRDNVWSNALAISISGTQKSTLLTNALSIVTKFIDGSFLIATVFFAARDAMSGASTVGVLYAFIAYRNQFMTRAQTLTETVISWRLLDIHTHRIADIALHPQELTNRNPSSSGDPLRGRISIRNATFAYSPTDKPTIRSMGLEIAPGQLVAITGGSGEGKSTLLKLIAGLYKPQAGEVLVDGLSTSAWNLEALRAKIGIVLQDDELLSGTIQDNVSFFAEEPDMDHVWACLRTAAIDKYVRSLPMQLHTVLGEMGGNISGGQKQRLLLARALYKRPSLLLLDEATSHLDADSESIINQGLKGMNITRIVVAHRAETIRAADRVVVVRGGMAFERAPEKA